jgi:hypothetical protein
MRTANRPRISGARLEAICLQRGIPDEVIAVATCSSTAAVRRWRREESQPRGTAIPALIDCLRCSYADLVEA